MIYQETISREPEGTRDEECPYCGRKIPKHPCLYCFPLYMDIHNKESYTKVPMLVPRDWLKHYLQETGETFDTWEQYKKAVDLLYEKMWRERA